MIDDADYALLDRYLADECSSAERERVEQWAGAGESHAELVEWLRTMRASAASSYDGAETEELWRGLRVRMQSPSLQSLPSEDMPTAAGESHPRLRRPTPRIIMRTAPRWWARRGVRASGAIAAAIVVAAVWQKTTSEPTDSALVSSYRTARAQRTIVRLRDGTRVTLAASSTLNVPESYGRRDREVQLTGEAYFEVVPDHTRPFRVHGEGTVAEALGTRFGVRAYREDRSVAVVVEEGTVAVGTTGPDKPAERVVLSRGDLARVEQGGRVLLERNVSVSRYLGWVHGRLEFVDTPLSDAAREIGRWYDVDVVVDDSALARSTLSASFSNERLDEVISALAASVEARAEYSGRMVRLSPLR